MFSVFIQGENTDMEKDEFNKRFGLKVKHLRKAKGLSQEELAERIQKTVDTVSSTERGITSPRVDTVLALSETFEVPIHELFMVESVEPWDRERYELLVQIQDRIKGQHTKVLQAVLKQVDTLISVSNE